MVAVGGEIDSSGPVTTGTAGLLGGTVVQKESVANGTVVELLVRAQRWRTRFVATLAVVAAVFAVIAPVLLLVFAGLIGLNGHRNRVVLGAIAAATFILVSFGVSNASKDISGDWVWYTQHFALLEHIPLGQYLGHRTGAITASTEEPLYYSISALVSRLSHSNVPALAWTVTALVYIPTGIAAILIAHRSTRDMWVAVAAVTAAMLCGPTFTLSTQIVRQEIAGAFITLAIVLLSLRRAPIAVMLLGLAVLTHRSASIPVAAVVAAVLLSRREAPSIARIGLVFGVFVCLGLAYIRFGGGSDYDGYSDGSIGIETIALDASIFIAFVLTGLWVGWWGRTPMNRSPNTPPTWVTDTPGSVLEDVRVTATGSPPALAGATSSVSLLALCVVPGLVGFIVGIASQPLPLLRIYFYLQAPRSVILALVVAAVLSRVPLRLVGALLVCAASIGYVVLRIGNSPFHYATLPLDLLLWSWFR